VPGTRRVAESQRARWLLAPTIVGVKTTAELREGFLSFFEEKGHLRRASAPVIPPADDHSTLFVVAGMQPMQRWFLGLEEPPAKRIATVQKVMRAGGKHNDLDDVGRTARTASFFEMLGNFSFGDYFKDGAIDLAWEFVTAHLRFPTERLWATVFAGDPELGLGEDEDAVRGWRRVGIPPERIVALPRSENFWQAAETGPCGPNTELFLDRGEEHGCGRPTCAPGCECDRFLEFWNLVFMEFELREDGTLVPLPNQNVDTGLGLERGAMLLQGVDSIFDTDGYQLIMDWVAGEAGVRYGDSDEATRAHRVLADHGRAMTFLIADGVTPSNEGRGYVLRRLIRRSVLQGQRIGLERIHGLPAVVVAQVERWYPEVREHAGEIELIVRAEEGRFRETLERGMRLFEELAGRPAISGEDAFTLAATHGFPIELTVELAEERGQPVDVDGYQALMEEHRVISQAGGEKGEVQRAAEFAREAGFQTEFVGYEKTDVLTQIGALEDLGDGLFLAKLRESPFYPAGGGQVTDAGFVELDGDPSRRAVLREAYRFEDDQVLLLEGEGFSAGDRARAVVPWAHRFPTMANHTATHLLHKALQEVLGDHVRQAGSAVRPDKLRFDFTHPQALGPEEREAVERRVNDRIFENLPVRAFVTPIEEARKLGATMLFGEKYGEHVRVVEIPGYSRELCGGTHVRWTAEIGPFVILSENSVGAGARRIEAVTAGEGYAYLRGQAGEAAELRAELERVRKEARRPQRAEAGPDFVAYDRHDVAGQPVVVAQVKATKGGALRDLSDRVRQQEKAAAVLLGSTDDGRAYLVFNLDQSLADRGVDAVALVREAATRIGGGGGGKPTLAEAGGRNPESLAEAIEVGKNALASALE
jgi:alanyl-tRNA synthetase